jgi:hypothetical protein
MLSGSGESCWTTVIAVLGRVPVFSDRATHVADDLGPRPADLAGEGSGEPV